MSVFSFMRKNIFRIFISAVLIFALLAMTACSRGSHSSALEMMLSFAKEYDLGGVIYSPDIKEGERGYTDENFFNTLYDADSSYVEDYSVLLLSGISDAGECGVFLCYGAYDAIMVSEMCLKRLDLLRSLAGSADTSFTDDAFVIRRGRVVVMCALSDNMLAKHIWEKII